VVRSLPGLAVALGLCFPAGNAAADDYWHAPFGGSFSANFTITSDYSYAGISQTELGPAFQAGLDYTSADLGVGLPASLYVGVWGTNVAFPNTGNDVELTISGGARLHAFADRLTVDLGYVRYAYPGVDQAFGYDYGELSVTLGYNFGVASVTGRLRYSPDSFANSGPSWNKRALVNVPLPFLALGDIAVSSYATLGNVAVEKYLNYGIPGSDYWYWQFGLTAAAKGFALTLAYTGTSIDPEGCGNTANCSGRFFVSLTKTF
jgi:uncharacterized protein (TIGR02001 family)